MTKCPKCGTETESKFCPNCGANLQESQSEEPAVIVEESNDIPADEKTEKKKDKKKKSKTTICKHCGAEIATSAKACPKCGGKNKKPIYKRVWFWILIVALVIFAIIILGSGNSYKKSDDASNMSEADYQAACQEMSYTDLARNAEDLVGQKVKFTGEIFQVAYDADGSGESEYIVSVTKDEWDFYTDNVYLYYDTGDGPNLIENDIITFYGEVSGTYSYTSVLGEEITIPAITGVYCYIN